MARQVANYRRFYSALNKLPKHGNNEDTKETLVSAYTKGRTTHLHEMKPAEYAEMCRDMERQMGYDDQRKRKRSICLKLMQEAGIDTTDWARINEFCFNRRIAGKKFAYLGLAELEALAKKLRAIIRSGGLKNKAAENGKENEPQQQIILVNYGQQTDKQCAS